MGSAVGSATGETVASTYDALGLPQFRLLLVSKDLYDEYQYRKREIDKLKAYGTHPADTRVQTRLLQQWVEQQRDNGMGGFWPIPI